MRLAPDLLSGVKDLYEAVVVLLVLIDGLVQRLVVFDPFPEIGDDFVDVVEGHVVGAGHLHLSDVALDDGLVEADRLDEEQLEAFLNDDGVVQRPAALLRRVGGVEDGDFAVLVLQVVQHVLQTLLADLRTKTDT